MTFPAEIVAGDSKNWRIEPFSDVFGTISSPGWTLSVAIAGASSLNLTGIPETGGWRLAITTSESAALEPGVYYWQSHATDGTERITVGGGTFTVKPNLAEQSAPFDGRSQAEKDLAAVQAAIRAIVSGGAVAEYMIGNRSLRKIPLADLMALESKMKQDVARERRAAKLANGLPDPGSLYVRFK